MTQFKRYDYSGATRGHGKHDFQPTGKRFVLQYVHMGACTEDEVDECFCTKCGLSAYYHGYRKDDCPNED